MTAPRTLIAGAVNRCHSACLLCILGIIVFTGCVSNPPPGVTAIHDLQYGLGIGHPLLLDIYRPAFIRKKLPVIIWIHGGAWNSGSKKNCPIAFLAANQVAIVSMDYRLTSEAPFPAQLHDCKSVVQWIRANARAYNLDPNRIGAFGASAGGHLALLLATTSHHPIFEGASGDNGRFSSSISCACALYPPTDLNELVSDPEERRDPFGDVARLVGGAVQTHVVAANNASPLFYVSSNTAPIFLIHGENDKLVPPFQSLIFYKKLVECGVPAHLEIIPNKGHGLIPPVSVVREVLQFFTEYLGVNFGSVSEEDEGQGKAHR